MATTVDKPRVAPHTDAGTPPADRNGSIAIWAILGALGITLALQTWVRWIGSGEMFKPAPILGPDHYPTWREICLRVTEVLSFFEMATLFTFAVVLPLRRTGKLGIDAKLAAGCLIGCVSDGILNMHQYLFAWNAHSVNRGSWASFLPLATEKPHERYAEALIWGIPMYTYFCIGVAIVGCSIIRRMRARNPNLTNARALGAIFVYAFIFDLVLENIIIRLGNAYAFAKTPSAITIDAGSVHQFPLYESLCVAVLGVLFTSVRLSSLDSEDGLSYVERGVHRFRPSLQGPLRWVACIGFSMSMLILVYHLPFNWLGMSGNSIADLPSYMKPGP